MSKQQYQTLFAYSWHTAQRLLDQATLLDESEVYAHPGFGHGSIYDLFVHLLSASQRWRVALETGQPPPRVQTAGFERLAAVREALAQEYERWQAYLAGLSAEEVAGPVTLYTARGDRAELVRWRVLQHLTLHAMQHHTEIAQLLTSKGLSPGDIDFIFYEG